MRISLRVLQAANGILIDAKGNRGEKGVYLRLANDILNLQTFALIDAAIWPEIELSADYNIVHTNSNACVIVHTGDGGRMECGRIEWVYGFLEL